jgi:hypothetical protein
MSNRILVCSPNQALTILRETGFGQHVLIIYDDIATMRELYADYCLDKLNRSKEAILLLLYLERPELAKAYIENKGVDIKESQKEGAFAAVDAYEWFFGSDVNADEMISKMFEDLHRYGRQGASIIRDIGVFFLRDEGAKMIGVETEVQSKINPRSKIICCVHKNDFERLAEVHKELLISAHDKVLGIANAHDMMFEEALAQSVSEAMSIYGKQVAQVVSSYLEREYSIPPETLAENPHALVEALEKVLDSGSRIVERRILRSLYTKIGSPLPQSQSTSDFEKKISEAKQVYRKYYER